MITIKAMNERWLNEVKDYIIDSTIRENNVDWDFLDAQVDNLEGYLSDGKDALVFDVKGMGYADYDEINKAFKKLGHEDLDAQDFSEDIYEICQFDNETIFHDIENYLEVPFYAMGRMGGHWGVLCEDVCDKYLVDVEINEKELWKYIEKNYDLNDCDDIWDIDCEDVGRYADENCFNFVADKDFVKHLNNAWDEIKKQSDYMLTYDYAEYIAERLIEDNFLESKKSTRKSLKESTINTLDDVEFELLNIAKNYGIAMEGNSKGLLFLNKEVSPNLIRKLNDKYYDEYSPYPPYLLAMKELLFEYDKGFSKFMDVYSKIK